MVCGVNSCQSELARAELVAHDGRFNTELVPRSFGAVAALFRKTFGFRAGAVQRLGFFFTARADRETIAHTERHKDLEPKRAASAKQNTHGLATQSKPNVTSAGDRHVFPFYQRPLSARQAAAKNVQITSMMLSVASTSCFPPDSAIKPNKYRSLPV